MTFCRFLFIISLFLLCRHPRHTNAIRNGVLITSRMVDNRPNVWINFAYAAVQDGDIRHSGGNLINRLFVLTTAIPSRQPQFRKDLTVRIGTLRSFEGGQLKEVAWVRHLKHEGADMRFDMALLRLKVPYDAPGDVDFAFWIPQGFRPRGINVHSLDNAHYKISGWHGVDSNWLGHQLSGMVVRETRGKDCKRYFANLGNIMSQEGPMQYAGCYVHTYCADNKACSDRRGPWKYDDGAGVYTRGTNIMIAITQARAPTVNGMDPAALVSYVETVHRLAHPFLMEKVVDDFTDYPEFQARLEGEV